MRKRGGGWMGMGEEVEHGKDAVRSNYVDIIFDMVNIFCFK